MWVTRFFYGFKLKTMEEHIKWWNNLPEWERRKLAFDEHWTTIEKITDYQIKMVYVSRCMMN